MSEGNSDLPTGWERATLADVILPSKEKLQPDQFANRPYLGLEHIEGVSNRILNVGKAAEVRSTKAVFHKGDVLYGKLRPYLRKVCRPDFDGICSTDILVFPQSPTLDSNYLLHFLGQHSTAEYATQNANGINLPRVSARVLGEIEFRLPPLPEQRRIAAKIDALQARSRRTREALSEVVPLLEKFRQSVLAAAFRGDLTAAWRHEHPDVEPASELLNRIRAERRRHWEEAELAKVKAKGKPPTDNKWKQRYVEPDPIDDADLPELPESWCWATLQELTSAAAPLCYGVVQPGAAKAGGPKLVRVCDLDGEVVVADRLRTIGQKVDEQYQRSRLLGGEVLVSVVGTIGRVAIVPEQLGGANIARALARLSPSSFVGPDWLANYLRTPIMQDWLNRGAREVARKTLNLGVLERAAIPLAPQLEISRVGILVNRLLKSVQSIEAASEDARTNLANLDQSILAKAFRGELVPQNPNDEPAAVLQERIRTQRAAQEAAGQRNGSPRRQRRQRIVPPAAPSVNGNGKLRGKAKAAAPKNGKRGKSPKPAQRRRRRTVRR